MIRFMIIMLIVCVLVSSTGFGMTVSSSSSHSLYMDNNVIQAGGRHMSDDELVLMVVGIVCGTILVLAILD